LLQTQRYLDDPPAHVFVMPAPRVRSVARVHQSVHARSSETGKKGCSNEKRGSTEGTKGTGPQ
jgi:hypothetical protein